jgi:hypothetical protein
VTEYSTDVTISESKSIPFNTKLVEDSFNLTSDISPETPMGLLMKTDLLP